MMCYSIIIYVLLLFVNKLSEKVQKKNFMCTAAFAPKKIVSFQKYWLFSILMIFHEKPKIQPRFYYQFHLFSL